MAKDDQFLQEMGIRIVHRRKQIKITQEKLAELAGVSIKTVVSAENGQKALRPENIVRFAKALDMNISYLLTGDVSDQGILSKLSHEERIAFDSILNAFLSICKQKDKL